MILTEEERQRYRRNILVPGIGEDGQLKLKRASVLIVGVGGLGSPIALYLAAAGIGRIGLIDGDYVDISNLQRQVSHFTSDIGRPKVQSAKEKMLALNPNINIETYTELLDEANAEQIISRYDFIVDATDSRITKFLINDICVKLKKPYSHGAIFINQGHAMTILPETACYRCLFDSMLDEYGEKGQFGVVPGIIGMIQATETIKYLLNLGDLLVDRLLIYEATAMKFTELKVVKSKHCKCSEVN